MTFHELTIHRKAFLRKQETAWHHTSSLLSLQANINSGKGKSYKPDDFNPYVKTLAENEGITTKEDVRRVREIARNL